MALGRLQNEVDLENFIREILDRLPLAGFVSQLQSSLAQGGRLLKVRCGTSSVTFTAADASAQVSIAHGIGSIPVLCGGFAATPANARISVQETAAADATNIYLKGFQSSSTAITATQTIYWLAIG